MTPEMQEMLDRLEKVLDPATFEMVRNILIGLWSGGWAGAGMSEWIKRFLLEWAAKEGTWMWLTIKDAIRLVGWAGPAEGAAGAIALGALAPLLLFFGGLLLPASKLGDISVEFPYQSWDDIFDDDCDTIFGALADAWRQLRKDIRAFGLLPSRDAARALIREAQELSSACSRFLIKCPDSPRKSAILKIVKDTETAISDGLDWLYHH